MVVHWYEASMLFNPLRRLSRASMSVLSFALDESFTSGQFGPRLGKLDLHRADGSSPPSIRTPALITATSRGIVPHLSQDHVALTKSIGWTQIHFESFLEQSPPVPTLQGGPHPLHTFLHHRPDQQIIALSVRDPHDGREITANGKDFVSVRCVRGVRKMTPTAWRSYVLSCNPDVVTALSDIPFTNSPQSQKRTIKTLERSTAWLADLLRPIDLDSTTSTHPLNVLVHMVGGTEDRARKAFSETLLEKLQGKEMEVASPLTTLDEGLRGYVFDLVPLRASILQEAKGNGTPEDTTARIQALMDVSLRPLPTSKLRVVHSAASPHEILRLIRDVGVDLFDARWAQHAATLGVALDFSFPVRDPALLQHSTCNGPIVDPDGKLELGHNLFSSTYAHDHVRLASSFLDAVTASSSASASLPVCPCAACSPISPSTHIVHSSVDSYTGLLDAIPAHQPPFTRAYLHHLLHTHEMSSHALLVMHNLAVMDTFFAGVRDVLSKSAGIETFNAEIDRFVATYSEAMTILEEASVDWTKVDRARGKGRLMREKAEADSAG